MTDELLVHYIDNALDRRKDRIVREFESQVEAVRIGTVFAHNKKAYDKWQRRKSAPKGRSLSGDDLERAIVNLAQMYPENVIRVTA